MKRICMDFFKKIVFIIETPKKASIPYMRIPTPLIVPYKYGPLAKTIPANIPSNVIFPLLDPLKFFLKLNLYLIRNYTLLFYDLKIHTTLETTEKLEI